MILEELRADLEKLAVLGRLRECVPQQRREAAYIELRGRTLLDFGSWDYLGVGAHKQVKRALQTAVEQGGVSSGSSRLSAGTSAAHVNVEKRLAEFLNTEAALVLHSRNQAVLSLLTAVTGESDMLYVDELLQCPVHDAAYLVNAAVETYKDIAALEALLQKDKGHRRRFIIADSLSPLSGAVTDLAPLFALANRCECSLIVDESFALGAIGPRGAGGAELLAMKLNQPVQRHMLALIADLSFGVGTYGGVVAGSRTLIDFVINHSRSLSVDPAVPPALLAATDAALGVVELKLGERERICALAQKIKAALPSPLLLAPIENVSPVVTLRTKKLKAAYEIAAALLQRGIFVEAASRGTLLSEEGIVRMVVGSRHSERQADDLVRALSELQLRAE